MQKLEFELTAALLSNDRIVEGVENMANLINLNEACRAGVHASSHAASICRLQACVMYNIRFRHKWDLIYTYSGGVLIAVRIPPGLRWSGRRCPRLVC